MALIFCDGFDSYGVAGDLTKKWQTVQSPWRWVAGIGRFGGGAMQATGAASGARISPIVGVVPTNQDCMGFWIKLSGPPSAQTTLVAYTDGTGANSGEYLMLNTSGTIQIMWPFGGAGLSSPAAIADNQWHWIEWEALGASTRRLFIDNILQLNFGDAHGATIQSIGFYSINGVTITVDDVMVYDSSAGAPTPTNFPLSARQISTLRPVSDGVCNFATLSAGTTHFNLVNEVNPDGDASYCEDGTSGNQDLFNMSALGFTPAGITTVVANAYMETGVPGTINNQMVCKSGATTGASSSLVTSNVYSTRQASFPLDPNTSVAWTPAGLAAAQFGYKNP